MKIIGRYTTMHIFFVLAFAKAIFLTTSCKTESYNLNKAVAAQVAVDSTQVTVATIEDFIAPYKARVDSEMNIPLSYNPVAMTKSDARYNTAIGNLMATMAYEQASAVLKARNDKPIDIVILNHGGIRAGLPAGNVTLRNAYEVMPFENEMIYTTLTGIQIKEMVDYLVTAGTAHPIQGLKITLNSDKTLKSATVNNKAIADHATYTVLTNDYLFNGGDNMSFFKGAVPEVLNYKLRNALIDYFKRTDTLRFKRDDRFDILK